MSVNKDEIKYLSLLSRMDIDKNEIKDIEEKLTKIIDFVDQLQTISTDNIEPMAHPLNQSQRLRIDEVTETNDRENIQKNAQQIEKGMYLVPKVID
ncbi:MAG: Asp-tRNA(Asn)/Glu-tRNA(Gln) amidotransferase subunit GatC [Woeseiaceae bacterium]